MNEPRKNENSSRRFVFVAMGVFISVIFLFLAFRDLQPDLFFASLTDVNLLWILIGAVTYFGAVTIIAWRWQFLLKTVQQVPLPDLTQIVAIGYMGNNVYPFRAGEALRIFLLRRDYKFPVASAATTVIVERVFDGIVMLSFLLVGLSWLDIQNAEINFVLRVALPIFGIAVVTFFTLALLPDTTKRLVDWVAHLLPEALAQIIIKLHEEIFTGLSSLRSPLDLLGAVITSYTTWAVEAFVYWMVMWAFNLDLSYGVALLVVGTVNLAGLLPASPGQFGVYEFFASTVLVAVGIAENTALAYAIVVHIVIWLPVTLVGFFFLIQRGLGWSAVTSANELNP